MRSLLASLCVFALSACGDGVAPELYAVVVDFFTLPDSCYLNNAQPSNVTASAAPTQLTFQVWDGPEGSFLDIETARMIDMGDAPTIAVGGVLKGKKDNANFIYSSETVTRSTQVGRTVTNTGKIELSFPRQNQFKGTGTLQSSAACSGSTCQGMQPSCSVSLAVTGTRLKVDYQRTP